MASQKLENYLRAYRRKTGLTQRDVAYLLGFEAESQVSRYEKRTRIPPLATALACEAVFGIPVSELFAGLSERAGRDVEKRLARLKAGLEYAKPVKKSEALANAQKLQWLAGRENQAPAVEKTTTL